MSDHDDVVWTPSMPDRRLADRRSGLDRREINGRPMTVPDVRTGSDRRGEDRRKVRLTITGRALDA